jgi:hypothetical protein
MASQAVAEPNVHRTARFPINFNESTFFWVRRHDALTGMQAGMVILQGAAMTVSPQLQQKLSQAVQTSMRIEGYAPQASPQAQAKAAELMKQQRVQVSVPSK